MTHRSSRFIPTMIRASRSLLLTASLASVPLFAGCFGGEAGPGEREEALGESQSALCTAGSVAPSDVGALSTGYKDACAIKLDGTVTCWGRNVSGNTPKSPLGTYAQIDSGGDGSCGIRTDGTIACWGGTWNFYAYPPAGSFSRIVLGERHGCGLRTDGTIACWGDNSKGQTQAPTGKFIGLASGYDTTCAIREDSTLACWGFDGSLYSFRLTTPPAGKYKQVSVGPWHACAIRATDSTVACWGMYGTAKSPPGTFSALFAGGGPGYDYDYTCGIRTDGSIACWYGQSSSFYTTLGGSYAQVAARYGTCALGTDGHVNCFDNVYWPDPLQPVPAGLVAKTKPEDCVNCAHDVCAMGTALTPACDPCVATVCADDPYCCANAWDSTCVNKAANLCGKSCGDTSHDKCEHGAPLDADSDPCVADVCAVDPFCCSNWWDLICVSAVGSVCGLTCP